MIVHRIYKAAFGLDLIQVASHKAAQARCLFEDLMGIGGVPKDVLLPPGKVLIVHRLAVSQVCQPCQNLQFILLHQFRLSLEQSACRISLSKEVVHTVLLTSRDGPREALEDAVVARPR